MVALTVITGHQAGKVALVGNMPAFELVKELRNETFAVNEHAQRSLAKGAGKETTNELLQSGRVEIQPRMKSLVKFLKRVMRKLESDDATEGFFGTIQFVVPESFKGATLSTINGVAEGLPTNVHDALNSLGTRAKLGVMRLNPQLGEVALHIGDGQGRSFAFHSLEQLVKNEINKLKKAIKKKEKDGKGAHEEEKLLVEATHELEGIRKFLSETDIGFICYAASVEKDGQIVGLPIEAERRLYIEGNALNSQASKEEVLKYESYSPVVLLLADLRTTHDWMAPEYIEEDSKNISGSSTKLFTLSALTQAFSFSVIGDNKPLKIDETDFEEVEQHEEFVSAFWDQVTSAFGATWIPAPTQSPTDRLEYLKAVRGERRNVTFQAIFLMALGRLCYQMGVQAKWDPHHMALQKLKKLAPVAGEFDAWQDGKWNQRWVNTMMKQVVDSKTGDLDGYSFNNTRENIEATYRELARMIDFVVDQESSVKEAEAVAEPA